MTIQPESSLVSRTLLLDKQALRLLGTSLNNSI